MRRTRVALVISNLEYGGAQRQVVELANNLPSERFRVSVVSLSRYVPLAEDLISESVSLHIIEKGQKYDWTVVRRLARYLREEEIDVAHAFLFDAEIASRLACWWAATPIMVGSERNSNYRIKVNQKIAYRLTRKLRRLCIANSHAGAAFNASALGYPESHYRVVHNCVDLMRFRPKRHAISRSDIGLRPDAFVIGMFASIKPQKNHPMLIDAIANNEFLRKEAQVLIVGEALHRGAQDTDEYRDYVLNLVETAGLMSNFRFVGNKANVQDYYSLCDLTVLPSNFEGLPNVLLESLACGVPVIATDVSDNAMLIENGVSGFIVRTNDPASLSRHLVRLMGDHELRLSMGREARNAAEKRFSPSRFVESVANVYAEVMGEQ